MLESITVRFTPSNLTTTNPVTQQSTIMVRSAPLTVTARSQSRVYGAANPILTFNYTGLVNGDTAVAFNGELETTASINSAVGSYLIRKPSSFATANGNYTIDEFEGSLLSITRAPQSIRFSPFPTKLIGEADFALEAVVSSGLTVTYTSENVDVARIDILTGKIKIVGTGTTVITASQAGNTNYLAALDEKQTLVVSGTPIYENIAPVISAGPTVSPAPITVGQTVAFSVTATDANGDILTYAWNFGDGASGTGSSVTHVFTTVGTYVANVTVTDGNGGSATGTVAGSVTVVPSVNNAPAITSGPTATPSTLTPGQTAAFAIAASDADGDVLSYAWNFGDGSSGTGTTPTHTFTAVGTYSVNVVVTDGKNGRVTGTITVTVEPIIVPPAQPLPLNIVKFGLKMSFSKTSSDSLSFSGTLKIPSGFTYLNQAVTVDVGGATRTFVLDSKGKSPKGTNTFSLAKPKNGLVKYLVKFSKENLALSLKDEGLVDSNLKRTADVVVTIVFNGQTLQATRRVGYTAKAGISGSAK